ncbi:hypothetical protein WA026_019201 [Henosepilachna vigintioctopunctata]|uniref:Nose resistant-to-fluoxetine protein N-terminal domain-containing protein n=1 Tax=Henosepilachna vigintioctopunctata TaxID=420089 RepID=A0AAW1V1H4_9CUCU
MKIYVVFFLLISCAYAYFEKECLHKVENAENIGEQCTKQLKILCKRHDILFTLWDASSKITRSGMTVASPLDLGNYDLCTKVDTRIEGTDILGKFCPYEWATMIPKKPLEEFVAALEILPNTLQNYLKLNKKIEIT